MIFRVEHRESGLGPYRYSSDSSLAKWHDRGDPSINHRAPVPNHDFSQRDLDILWANHHRIVFGFPSVDAIRRWFTKAERRWLKAKGFVIRRYRVEPIASTPNQCFFYHPGA